MNEKRFQPTSNQGLFYMKTNDHDIKVGLQIYFRNSFTCNLHTTFASKLLKTSKTQRAVRWLPQKDCWSTTEVYVFKLLPQQYSRRIYSAPHLFLEILQRYWNLLFWVLWARLARPTKTNRAILYETLMFIYK